MTERRGDSSRRSDNRPARLEELISAVETREKCQREVENTSLSYIRETATTTARSAMRKRGDSTTNRREDEAPSGQAEDNEKVPRQKLETKSTSEFWPRLTTTIIRAPPNLRSSEPHWSADFSISRKKDPPRQKFVLAQIKSGMLLHSIPVMVERERKRSLHRRSSEEGEKREKERGGGGRKEEKRDCFR